MNFRCRDSVNRSFLSFLCSRYSIDKEKRNGGGRATYTTSVAVKYDGNNTWLNPAMFKSICDVDVTNFPFDDQECSLKFGSWTSDKFKIDLVAKNIIALNRYYVNNGEWKLLNLSAKRNAQKYQCCPHEFVDITVRINIRRESLDYILKLIIPCSLISSMIFLGFVLPPESGERIGLSITVLLAMTVFQQLSSELMPSYGFPLLGQFYFAIMLEIGASLAVTTLILNFYHRNRRRMPKTMRKVILRWLARLLFPCQKPKDWSEIHRRSTAMRRMATNFIDLEAKGYLSSSDAASCESAFYRSKEKSARRDPHEHKWAMQESGDVRDGSRGNHSFCDLGVSCKNDCYNNRGLTKHRSKKNGDGQTRHKNCGHNGKKRLSSTKLLNRQLTTDSLPFRGNVLDWSEEKMKNQKEWIKAARVLDRLFLIISIIVSIVTLLKIFLRAPRFHLK